MVARMAQACTDHGCTDLLVRGDQIEFVSEEQARRVNCDERSCPTHLNERAMRSDIKLPRGYVLVHDTSGVMFSRCEFHIVRWYSTGSRRLNPHAPEVRTAREYFGENESDIRLGEVDVPGGPWRKRAEVRCIRYRRHGYSKGFEHLYERPVNLYVCRSPLAFRLALPDSCIVDARGFVRP